MLLFFYATRTNRDSPVTQTRFLPSLTGADRCKSGRESRAISLDRGDQLTARGIGCRHVRFRGTQRLAGIADGAARRHQVAPDSTFDETLFDDMSCGSCPNSLRPQDYGNQCRADVVLDWNEVTLAAIQRTSTPPPVAARALTMTHVAIYDAVNSIEPTHQSFRVYYAVSPTGSRESAAAQAAFRVLQQLFPSERTRLEAALAKGSGRWTFLLLPLATRRGGSQCTAGMLVALAPTTRRTPVE